MVPKSLIGSAYRMISLALTSMITLACTPMRQSDGPVPAPAMKPWSDSSFLPGRQCNGRYTAEEVKWYLPRARLALWLPSTRSVVLNSERRCLVVTVESVGTARLAELLLRAAAVPRRVFLLQVG